MDDLITMESSPQVISNFKAYLSNWFKMKDIGIFKYFWGIEVVCNALGIYLCQQNFAIDTITEARLLGVKPACSGTELLTCVG